MNCAEVKFSNLVRFRTIISPALHLIQEISTLIVVSANIPLSLVNISVLINQTLH